MRRELGEVFGARVELRGDSEPALAAVRHGLPAWRAIEPTAREKPGEPDVRFDEATKTLVVSFWLPEPALVPNVVEYKFVAARKEIKPVEMKPKEFEAFYDDAIHQSNPIELVRRMEDCPEHLAKIKNVDFIFPIGRDDSAYWNNAAFSQVLWDRGVWHAFREWDGFAHDWDYWKDMVLHYIGGPESREY